MVHSGIFATSDEILTKAGANYSTGVTEARINALCLQAESIINVMTRKNWSDAYAAINVDFKYILSDAEACWVAMWIINYNMSPYTSRSEAETMLNVLRDSFVRDIEILKDQAMQTFMGV